MSVILQSSGGGQITIQEPATASNFTQTLPAATGTVMVSGNQPAFSAFKSSNQTISVNTYQKITYDTEEFDTNNNFASSRFTPTVAGYYQISATASFAPVNDSLITVHKNGSVYKWGTYTVNSTGAVMLISTLVYLNGSTDYVEIYVYGGTTTIYGDSKQTWFNGCLLRGA